MSPGPKPRTPDICLTACQISQEGKAVRAHIQPRTQQICSCKTAKKSIQVAREENKLSPTAQKVTKISKVGEEATGTNNVIEAERWGTGLALHPSLREAQDFEANLANTGRPCQRKKKPEKQNKQSMYRQYKIIGFRTMAQSAVLPQKCKEPSAYCEASIQARNLALSLQP